MVTIPDIAGGKDTIYAGDGDDLIESGTNDDRLGENAATRSLVMRDLIGSMVVVEMISSTAVRGNSYDGGTESIIKRIAFVVDGGHLSDIQQRNSNTCVILASIGAGDDAGFNPPSWCRMKENAIYSVKLFLNNVWKDIKVQFDGTLKSDDPASAVKVNRG